MDTEEQHGIGEIMSDDELLHVILGPDQDLAQAARRIFLSRHRNDPEPTEPHHCSECFEGCPKCGGK